jgi:hypothetical protein
MLLACIAASGAIADGSATAELKVVRARLASLEQIVQERTQQLNSAIKLLQKTMTDKTLVSCHSTLQNMENDFHYDLMAMHPLYDPSTWPVVSYNIPAALDPIIQRCERTLSSFLRYQHEWLTLFARDQPEACMWYKDTFRFVVDPCCSKHAPGLCNRSFSRISVQLWWLTRYHARKQCPSQPWMHVKSTRLLLPQSAHPPFQPASSADIALFCVLLFCFWGGIVSTACGSIWR